MENEKNFEVRVKSYLNDHNILRWGSPIDQTAIGVYLKIWGGGYQAAGIPDMLICVRGRFIAVELKGHHGRPSSLQKVYIRQGRGIGMQACFLYPSGFEEFKRDFARVIENRKTKLKEIYR